MAIVSIADIQLSPRELHRQLFPLPENKPEFVSGEAMRFDGYNQWGINEFFLDGDYRLVVTDSGTVLRTESGTVEVAVLSGDWIVRVGNDGFSVYRDPVVRNVGLEKDDWTTPTEAVRRTYSPGPWRLDRDGWRGQYIYGPTHDGDRHLIAEVTLMYDSAGANAMLIAAAPEMRRALEDLVNYIEAQDLPETEELLGAYAALRKSEIGQ